ncbi:MAG TPA: hypothetical protein VHP33_16550 [Polyangiaceae bacterium]|nr:hypothetical protein [Polyangiaceae bacterium]
MVTKIIWARLVVGLGVGAGLVAACSTDSSSNQAPNAAGGEAGAADRGAGARETAGSGRGLGVGGVPETGGDVGASGRAEAGSTSAGAAVTGEAGSTSESSGGQAGATTSNVGGAEPNGAAGAANPVYGYCAKPCGTVADCCPAGAPDCPGNTYPNNYACVLGACRSPECVTTEDCQLSDPKTDCFENDGFAWCGLPCTSDDGCKAPQSCSGVDDHGKKFCLAKGTGCTDDDSCHGYGKCVDKVCVCEDALDCTSRTFSTCAL